MTTQGCAWWRCPFCGLLWVEESFPRRPWDGLGGTVGSDLEPCLDCTLLREAGRS